MAEEKRLKKGQEAFKIYKEVLRFLRVDPDFKAKFKIVNPSKTLRFKSLKYRYDNIIYGQDPTSIMIRRIIKSIIPIRKKRSTIEEKIYDLLYSKAFYRVAPLPPLPAAFIAELKKNYKNLRVFVSLWQKVKFFSLIACAFTKRYEKLQKFCGKIGKSLFTPSQNCVNLPIVKIAGFIQYMVLFCPP